MENTPIQFNTYNFMKWGIYPSIQQALHDILESPRQITSKSDEKILKSNSDSADSLTKSFFKDMNDPD